LQAIDPFADIVLPERFGGGAEHPDSAGVHRQQYPFSICAAAIAYSIVLAPTPPVSRRDVLPRRRLVRHRLFVPGRVGAFIEPKPVVRESRDAASAAEIYRLPQRPRSFRWPFDATARAPPRPRPNATQS
jgi:hypothetical protein